MSNDYEFKLSDHEQQTHLWKKIQIHFKYILERERSKNDSILPEHTTAAIRGKISLAKELLALDEIPSKVEPGED